MPSILSERPATVEEAPQGNSSAEHLAVQKVQLEAKSSLEGRGSKSLSRRQQIAIQSRKMFEGHEEFLGWTPD
ncbi:MAG: hypothetical protein WAM69_17920 [Candidatus Sulfotelmatobacter sp.]